jgi:hypothetical protein
MACFNPNMLYLGAIQACFVLNIACIANFKACFNPNMLCLGAIQACFVLNIACIANFKACFILNMRTFKPLYNLF